MKILLIKGLIAKPEFVLNRSNDIENLDFSKVIDLVAWSIWTLFDEDSAGPAYAQCLVQVDLTGYENNGIEIEIKDMVYAALIKYKASAQLVGTEGFEGYCRNLSRPPILIGDKFDFALK
jgi:hypothetical protein